MRTILATLAVAAATAIATPAVAADLSASIMRPTPVDASTGRVAGQMPGASGPADYYVAVDLKPGDLMTQLVVSGTPGAMKKLTLELLNSAARIADSGYVMTEREGKATATKSYPIDSAGRYVIRLRAEGKEAAKFCVLLGGSALPTAVGAGCEDEARASADPAPAPAIQPPAESKQVQVIRTKCEARLRIGSDLLFDFDRHAVRAEALAVLDEVKRLLGTQDATVEGHTDGKGTDSYNQALSERRAEAVRAALVDRGMAASQFATRGFGKTRPVAPNEQADGKDDPEGRQKNRRVEIVVNTCAQEAQRAGNPTR